MPLGLVLAYLEMMPRLRAERQLELLRAVRLGHSASIGIDDVKSIERDLEREARPAQRRRAKKASAEALAAMGIGIVTAPAESAMREG